jgi:DNA-binding XRE family transcriptional regulator
VLEGIGLRAPWLEIRGSLLGSEGFARSIGRHVEEKEAQAEFPRGERVAHHEPLGRLFPPQVLRNRSLRDNRIREVSRTCAYSLSDIARHIGLHRSTVSKIAGLEAARRGPTLKSFSRASVLPRGRNSTFTT